MKSPSLTALRGCLGPESTDEARVCSISKFWELVHTQVISAIPLPEDWSSQGLAQLQILTFPKDL